MVDMSTDLGRSVPTPREVLEVIRPQLRAAAVIFPVIDVAFLTGDCLGSEYQGVTDVLFDALREDAVGSVKQWARDLEKVFDGDAMVAFIGEALNECGNGKPSDAVLDVLNLDEGVCESIGHVLRRLSVPLGDDALPTDKLVAGAAACYFSRV